MSITVLGAILGMVGSFISGLALQITGRWIAGGRPPREVARQHAVISGSPGASINQTDESRTEIRYVENVYHQQTSETQTSSDEDATGRLVLAGLASVLAALTFLFLWPLAIGFTIGAVALVCVAAWRTLLTTGHHEGPRKQIVAASTASFVAVAVAAHWTVTGGPLGERGMVAVERQVVDAFPRFGHGLGDRFDVLTRQPFDVIQAMGLQSVLFLMLAMCLGAAAAFYVASDLYCWWSFRNVATHRTVRSSTVRRAVAHINDRTSARWVGLSVMLIFCLACASGAFEALLSIPSSVYWPTMDGD